MGYSPRHSITKVVERLSWGRRAGISVGLAVSAAALGFTVLPGAGSAATASCAAPCHDYQFGTPSGYSLDVYHQEAAAGTAVITYKTSVSDPAENFTAVNTETSTTPASYAKNSELNYQFMSDSPNVNNFDNTISNEPFDNSVFSDAYQTLGANGVSLTTSGQADDGVVVPLGRLSSLFNADGQYVPPAIVGSGLEGYNLYFDTSASGTYLGYPGGTSTFVDKGASATPPFGGTNKASMGAVNNTSDTADFVTWSGQSDSVIPTNSVITMEKVKADFASNPDGDTNPLVWAWIGTGDQAAGASAETGVVTSVDGTNLVNTTAAVTHGQNATRLQYTPYGNLSGAEAASNTAAEAAYNSSGTPKFCVGVADTADAHATLEPCALSETAFTATTGLDSHTLFELAANNSLALNDDEVGHNYSPVIAYAAKASYWNEEFWPGQG